MTSPWTGFWRLDPRPDGSPAPLGPMLVDTFEDKLEAVADGRAIALVRLCQSAAVGRVAVAGS